MRCGTVRKTDDLRWHGNNRWQGGLSHSNHNLKARTVVKTEESALLVKNETLAEEESAFKANVKKFPSKSCQKSWNACCPGKLPCRLLLEYQYDRVNNRIQCITVGKYDELGRGNGKNATIKIAP